jgi:hypothetical protein
MCDECKRGPSGQHGHPHLEERLRSGVRQDGEPEFVVFECLSCWTHWVKSGPRDQYAWKAHGDDTTPPP